jgi:hypothetical protein
MPASTRNDDYYHGTGALSRSGARGGVVLVIEKGISGLHVDFWLVTERWHRTTDLRQANAQAHKQATHSNGL